jgi:hypothetical protein
MVENSIDISEASASKELLIASLTNSSGLVKSAAISRNSRTSSTFGVIVNSRTEPSSNCSPVLSPWDVQLAMGSVPKSFQYPRHGSTRRRHGRHGVAPAGRPARMMVLIWVNPPEDRRLTIDECWNDGKRLRVQRVLYENAPGAHPLRHRRRRLNPRLRNAHRDGSCRAYGRAATHQSVRLSEAVGPSGRQASIVACLMSRRRAHREATHRAPLAAFLHPRRAKQ